MSHDDESVQEIVLPSPTLILHAAELLHVAVDPAPAFRSQFDEPLHEIELSGPPLPLQADESSQESDKGPSELPLHLADELQSSAQVAAPHWTLQSALSAQAHAPGEHTHPAPEHAGVAPLAGGSLAHPSRCRPVTRSARIGRVCTVRAFQEVSM